MRALQKLLQDEKINEVIMEPNNILGIEYLIALKKYKSNIIPKTLQRIKAAHNSKTIDNEIASASAIRSHILSDSIESVSQAMPEECFNILNQSFKEGLGPIYFDAFSQMFLYKIRTSSPQTLANILEVSEGLENKIFKEALAETDIEKIINNIKSKRYTMTRIHRIFLNILLDVTKDFFEPFKLNGPSYIRILGFSPKGQALLKKIKKNSTLPILSNLSDSNKYTDVLIKTAVDFEVKASSIYYLALNNMLNNSKMSGSIEYSHKIIKAFPKNNA
jgi:predicted nucleotidyltransferase